MPKRIVLAAEDLAEHRCHTEEIVNGIAYLECAGCGKEVAMPVMTSCYTLVKMAVNFFKKEKNIMGY